MKVLLIAASMLLAGSFSFATPKDTEHSQKTTVDHSTNPLTGTKKTVVTQEKKVEDENGNEANVEVKDTTKVTKKGKVTKKHEVDAESSHQ